jgi:hypothetical protein
MADERPLTASEVLAEEFVRLHGPGRLPEALFPPRLEGVLPQEAPKPERDEGERLEAIFRAVDRLDPRRAALCLSGGGIRSATFSLGVIQGLARAGWLPCFHYLSTVSGGGYIGGWLSAWIRRAGFDSVVAGLCAREAEGAASGAAGSATSPEPPQIRWLRAYSNYLSPRVGFSADFWALISVMLRNLLLHWVVFLPLLAAVLMLPRVTVALTAQLDPPGAVRWLVLLLALLLGAVGIAFVETDLPGSNRRPWPAGAFALGCLLPFLAGALLLSLFWAWHTRTGNHGVSVWTYVAVGVAVHAAGIFLGSWVRARRERGIEPRQGAGGSSAWSLFEKECVVALSGALGGFVLWFGSARVFPQPVDARFASSESYVSLAVPFLVAALSVATVLYVGLRRRHTSEDDREWWGRAGGWLLMVVTLWIVGHGLVIYGPPALLALGGRTAAAVASLGGLTGVVTAVWAYRSKLSLGDLAKSASQVRSLLGRVAPVLGTMVFALVLILLVSLATSFILDPGAHLSSAFEGQPHVYHDVLTRTPAGPVVLMLLVCAAVALGGSWVMGINAFSLHGMYGSRLVRAYLGASTIRRNPHPFTGFDPHDNVGMSELWPADANASRGPLHVVNLALNLVKADRLEWQQRKAESFTVTALHSGSANVGYRPSASYGGERGISLGKAMTISGAAASPNMGYHSSTLVAFLMTFFNARLGWWLPNPGPAGRRIWRRSEPEIGLGPLVAEALGRTTDRTRHVYLSDGGHFENLGLYEMVFRRCGLIVLVDAGCDPQYAYEDFAGAVRKIRADLGVPITLASGSTAADEKERDAHYAIATIHYSHVDPGVRDGMIIYVKPVLTGDEPIDVSRYAAAHKDPKNPFPQQSTMDQFFDEAQFESYRQLGEHSILTLVREPRWADPPRVFSRVLAL